MAEGRQGKLRTLVSVPPRSPSSASSRAVTPRPFSRPDTNLPTSVMRDRCSTSLTVHRLIRGILSVAR